ncbi:MAG TPA: protease modulator HflK [Kiritimatiellia bacterium]|nr:protease modulator HflK [Kiritimatiellia bacterium]
MNRHAEHAAVFATGLAILAAVIAGFLIPLTGLLAFAALLPLLFVLIAVGSVALLRIRLTRLAEDEKRDAALLAKEQPETSLFQAGESGDPFSLARSRAQVERYIVPLIAPLLGLALLYWGWTLHRDLPWTGSTPSRLALSGSLFGGMAFAFFLTSRFLLGLSRHPESRLLRGPGVLAGLVCWGAALGLAGALAEHFGFSLADEIAARILVGATLLLGAENLVNSLLALYSHRRERQIVTYESRLGALLVDPGILTRSVTEAMDYQFGFSFSQTWFFKILQKAVIPLLMVQATLLYAMSSLVFLGPHETGILERFGRPVDADTGLDSGFHLKRPWPFETVRRIPAKRIQLLEVGFEPHPGHAHPEVMTWSVPHYAREDVFLVASRSALAESETNRDAAGVPVSMITVNIPVEYRITNAYAYAYHFTEPDQVIRQLIYRTVTRELAQRELGDLFSATRADIGAAMRHALQAAVDRHALGVEIVFFGLQGVHPPVQVAESFQSVVGAMEEKEAAILEARAYTNRVLPIARAFALSEHYEAEAYRHRRAVLAEAEGERFVKRSIAYEASPRVFRMYHYLDMLIAATAPSRLYVLDLPAEAAQTLWFNLEEKPFSGALDMAPLLFEGGH